MMIVTDALGKRYRIHKDGSRDELPWKIPFVIDERPDLQVASIVPGLFLSSQDPVISKEILQKYDIHYVLSIGVEAAIKFDNVKYHYCHLLDLPECSIHATVKQCIKIIHQNRQENILVHCNAGVSRAPTIVIAYLMVIEKLQYEDAYNKVKHVRNCIQPNQGFVEQLKRLQITDLLP
ncbi:hypothetical protein KM043_004747 [Ampulex compressa]|nr:hypothetical protein KM043_004747 [Ampulex compressa]